MNKIALLPREVEKQLCERSLAAFIRKAWHVVEPGQRYQHNWHIDFICEHLEAITDGLRLSDGRWYNRLLVNIIPGAMKACMGMGAAQHAAPTVRLCSTQSRKPIRPRLAPHARIDHVRMVSEFLG